MPYKAKNPRRPWSVKPTEWNKLPGQGRFSVSGFYQSTAWRKLRNKYIQENPLCAECMKQEKYIAGEVVDHIRQINPVDPYDTQNGKYSDPLDESNLQTLCSKHHNQKSAKERWKK